MKTFLKLGLSALATSLLLVGCASDSSAPAATTAAAAPTLSDAEVAAKLKGQWTGQWSIAQYSGKFVLVVTGNDGANVTGEALFFGTATGDTKEPLGKATVEKGQLVAVQPSGMTLKIKLRNETTVQGSWATGNFNGDLKATRN